MRLDTLFKRGIDPRPAELLALCDRALKTSVDALTELWVPNFPGPEDGCVLTFAETGPNPSPWARERTAYTCYRDCYRNDRDAQ
jgi:hypothetical protein